MAGVHRVAQQGFRANVQAYETARPSFPADAIAQIVSLLRPDSQILDVGAGTGKFTRLLASKCGYANVQAVEPVEEMRECFQTAVPGVCVQDGSADFLPLPDSSMDCITCAQAFHWFANTGSLREFRRVLKPGGLLVLIWNLEDGRTPWVHSLRTLYEQHEQGTPQFRLGLWKHVWEGQEAQEWFQPLQQRSYDWTFGLTKGQAWQRVLSKSYISCLDAPTQAQLQQQCQAVLQDVPTRPDGTMEYPHTTTLVWTTSK
ncbi:hypothetical protein WJX74_002948 [Apatococcus lobatus]|uniref:Methyltransferase type 11 domain-containing protein n=1 Tax=Apatococcus lobatus TaxID=904363 RepID=A0AAW1QGV7_9CHLO